MNTLYCKVYFLIGKILICNTVYSICFFLDSDECALSTHNCNEQNAICANTFGSFNCSCIAGYSGDGITCSGKLGYIII